MTFDQMQYFAAVVEEGSISAAARRLHMSQPPLSLQIRNLESEYGVQLFERGARQIRLTEAGRSITEKMSECLLSAVRKTYEQVTEEEIQTVYRYLDRCIDQLNALLDSEPS